MGTEPKKKMKPERMGHSVTLKKKGLMKKAPPQDRMSLERKLAEGQKLAEEQPLLRPWASRARSKRSNKVTLHGGHLWELAAPFHPLFTPLLSEQGVISTTPKKALSSYTSQSRRACNAAETSGKKTLSLLLEVQSRAYPGN